MKWKPGRGAGQIEDRRGRGGGRGLAVGGGGLGIAGVILVLVLSLTGGGGGAPWIGRLHREAVRKLAPAPSGRARDRDRASTP